MEMPPSHQPRRRSPMVSCIERSERNEGRHLRGDKATRRLCWALCFVGLMAQFALVGRLLQLGRVKVGRTWERIRPGVSELSLGPRRGELERALPLPCPPPFL